MGKKTNKLPRYFGEDEFKAYPLFNGQQEILIVKGSIIQEIVEFVWRVFFLKGFMARFVWKRRLRDKKSNCILFMR